MAEQGLFTRGIYEFDDPAGALLAARIPATGSVDLFLAACVLGTIAT